MPNDNQIQATDALGLISSFEIGEIDAIITSPPYVGLPGRDETIPLIEEMLAAATSALNPSTGVITMIVGSTEADPLLPFHVAKHIEYATDNELALRTMYIWDRSTTLQRNVAGQMITHDYIIQAARSDAVIEPLSDSSIIRTSQPGFNYGMGVTTPPDLAALLVSKVSARGDLIIDPFAGLGEIGVQAIHQGRRFQGSDINDACVEIGNLRLNAMRSN